MDYYLIGLIIILILCLVIIIQKNRIYFDFHEYFDGLSDENKLLLMLEYQPIQRKAFDELKKEKEELEELTDKQGYLISILKDMVEKSLNNSLDTIVMDNPEILNELDNLEEELKKQ